MKVKKEKTKMEQLLNVMPVIAILVAITELLVLGIKKAKEDLNSNLIVLVSSIVVTALGGAYYILSNNIPFTPLLGVEIVIFGLLVWLATTVGYDKVKEAISGQYHGE